MTNELRRRRRRMGLSIAQMAEKTGLDKGLLSRLENRHVKNPWATTVLRAAQGYGLKPEEVQAFLADELEPEEPTLFADEAVEEVSEKTELAP